MGLPAESHPPSPSLRQQGQAQKGQKNCRRFRNHTYRFNGQNARDGSLNAFGQDWTAPVTFEDTFRVANGAAADGNTGFGVKIDYVFVEERDDALFRVEGASICSDAPGGSDHFPVMAEVVLLF